MAKHPTVSAVELGDQSWASLADAVRRLEDSWRATPNPELAQFVPPAGDPLRQRVLVELIKVDQEYRWQAGQQKKLETYLSRWPELSGKPEVVKELLEAECLTRAVLDKVPTPHELQCRFPETFEQIDLAVVEVQAERERASGCNGAAPPGQSDTSSESLQYTPSQGGAPPPLAVGERFGRYEIRGLLGEGGMAAVYRAYDTQLGREVALKIPQFDPAVEPTVLERFVREARAAAAIRHPNVCPIYDAGQIDGTYYIAMALIEGQSLAAWMQGREVAPLEAVELLLKLARALAQVHRAGIVHRDIKPSNVMIDQSGEPLLMDFGLARQAESEVHSADAVSGPGRPPQSGAHLTGLGSLLGTPAYMSPEQAMSRVADARSDVHGLGVLLYQMLTGKLPFGGEPLDLLRSIAYSPPPLLRKLRPELDAELEAVCLKAMAKDPADRNQSAGEMAGALQQYLQPSPQAAGPPSRRRRSWWIGAAGTAGMVLAFIAVLTVATNRGTLEIKTFDEDVIVSVLKNGQEVAIVDTKTDKKVTLRAGKYEVQLSDGEPGLWLSTTEFTLRRGDKVIVTVRAKTRPEPLVPGEPKSLNSFEFVWVADSSAGDDVNDVTIGDFNADGKLDVAVANYNEVRNKADEVSVLLGNGDGTFQERWHTAVGATPNRIASSDVNSDGVLDLVTANHRGHSVSVLLGNGDGSFQDRADYAAGSGCDAVAIGDLNKDNLADIVSCGYWEGTVSVHLGNARAIGTFLPQQKFPVESVPTSVALGDLDGNGALDIVVTNERSGTVSLLLGKGDGSFQARRSIPWSISGGNPHDVAIDRLNRDSKLDLVIANRSRDKISVLLGNGNGTFQPPAEYDGGDKHYSVELGDVDGDGVLDIATPNANGGDVSVFLGNGDGTFRTHSTYPSRHGYLPGAALGDLNNDGRPDMALATFGDGVVAVLMNQPFKVVLGAPD